MVRSKEARELVKKIKKAGGTVVDKGHGQLDVIGPTGKTARIGDSITAGRAKTQAIRDIKKYAELTLEP